MVSFGTILGCMLQHLSIDHGLTLVVQIVREEPLLGMQFLLAELINLPNGAHDSILILIPAILK